MFRAKFSLNEGAICVMECPTKPVTRIIFDALVEITYRPYSWQLEMSMGAFEVFDLNPLGSRFPTMISTKTIDSVSEVRKPFTTSISICISICYLLPIFQL